LAAAPGGAICSAKIQLLNPAHSPVPVVSDMPKAEVKQERQALRRIPMLPDVPGAGASGDFAISAASTPAALSAVEALAALILRPSWQSAQNLRPRNKAASAGGAGTWEAKLSGWVWPN
jgi:hypothetical protein